MGGEVTRHEIRRGLKQLGLCPGRSVVVHGSLKSFGRVAGGAPTVAAALVEMIGADGLVAMPVYRSTLNADGELLRTPNPSARVTTGAIPAAFAARPDARLALHPLYTYAFAGRDAAALARQHARLMFPYGTDQPLYCLWSRRGAILQLGVDDVTNTSIHVAEEIADPAYLAEKKTQSRLTVDEFLALPVEARRESLAHHKAGPRRDFRKATSLIKQAGIRRTAAIGRCKAALTDFVAMCELLIRQIRGDPSFLLAAPGP